MADFNLQFGVDISELVSGVTAATEAIQESSTAMKESLGTVSEAFGMIGQAAIAITSIMAGGRVFGDMISATVNLNVASMDLGKQFGISATQASVLKVALNETFVSQEQFTAAGTRVLRTLNTNEQAFTNLGVATRQSNGDFRPLADIVLDVNEKLLNLKEGTDRGLEATKIYGRGWQEISPVLRLTRDSMTDAAQTADELNLKVSAESEAATRQYRLAMVGVKDSLEGVKNTIGLALLPALTQLGNWFRSEGPAAISGTRQAIVGIMTVFAEMREEIKDEVDFIVGEFVSLVAEIKSDASVINDAIHFRWSDISSEIKTHTVVAKGIYAQYQEDLVANAKQAKDLIQSITAETINPPNTPTDAPTGTGTSEGAIDKAGLKISDERHQLLERMIKEDTDYINKMVATEMAGYQDQEAQASKAAGARVSIAEKEAALMAAAHGKDSAEYERAQKHIVDVQNQADSELRQMADAFKANETQKQLDLINIEEKAVQERYNKGEISANQLEQAELGFEARRTEIAAQGIRDRQALIDPTHDPVAYAKLTAQLEGIEQQHQTRMTQIQMQAAQNNRKLQDQAYNAMQSGFSNAISSMLKGTATFQSAIQQMCKSILDAVIEMISQWIAQWAMMQLKNLIMSRTAAASQVAAQAGVAGAAGTASFAGAPWPVDIGAPAFGAAMAASAGAFSIAEMGYDVPAHEFPMTQLHPRETVLPAELSDVIRGMAANGNRGGGSSLHLHAVDGRSVERMLTNQSPAMRRVLGRMFEAHAR